MAELTPSQKLVLRLIASRTSAKGYVPQEKSAYFEDKLGVGFVKTDSEQTKGDCRELHAAGLIQMSLASRLIVTEAGKKKANEIIEEGIRDAKKPRQYRRKQNQPKEIESSFD